MWGLGDLGFVVALRLVIAAWMRAEDADTARREGREDALAGAERATAERATAAERGRAREAGGAVEPPGSVAARADPGIGSAGAPAQADPGIGAAR